MKTIRQDVRTIIPNITEADFEKSLFIVELWTNRNLDDPNDNFFGLIDRKDRILPYDPYKYKYVIKHIMPTIIDVEWIPYGYNLLEVIVNTWRIYSRHYTIRISILENLSDILQWVNGRTSQLHIEKDSYKVLGCLNNQYANLPSHRQPE